MANPVSKYTKGNVPAKINQRIVQCPSCQTKYAVDGALTQQIETPRFHCSRCDHIFALDAGAFENVQPAPVPPQRQEPQQKLWPEPIKTEEVQHTYGQSFSATVTPESEFDLGHEGDGPLAMQAGSTNIFSSGQKPNIWREELVDNNPGDAEEHDSLQDTTGNYQSSFFEGLPADSRAEDFPEPRPYDPSILDDEAAQIKIEEQLNRVRSVSTKAPTAQRKYDFSGWEVNPTLPDAASDSSGKSVVTSRLYRAASPWKGLGLILGPVSIFAAFLMVACYVLGSDAKLARRFIDAVLPSVQGAAPAGLYIQNSDMKLVALSSGDRIPLITGTLVNRSDSAIKEVILEGLLFNLEGEIIAKQQVSASTTLNKAKLSSLSTQLVRELQSAGSSKKTALKKNGKLEFAFAILGNNKDSQMSAALANPNSFGFYTVRLFSVRN